MSEDLQRLAAAHYRVERETSGLMMRKRLRRKATEQAIEHGDAIPTGPQDVVRIYDREGAVVFERDWGSNRPDAIAQEAQIIDDLLHLNVLVFRAKYAIVPPEDEAISGIVARPNQQEAPNQATAEAPSEPAGPDRGAGPEALGAS